jgi:hypothetical protein
MNDQISDQVPLWWKEVFPAGACDGFFRRTAHHCLRFTGREAGLLVVSVEAALTAGQDELADRVMEPLTKIQHWAHLAVQVEEGETAFDALTDTLKDLFNEERFVAFEAVVLIGEGHGANLALRLAPELKAASTLAFCPETSGAASSPAVILFDPMMTAPSADQLTAAGHLLLRLPFLGADPIAAVNDLGLLPDLISGAATGRLTAGTFHRNLRQRKSLPIYQTALRRRLAARGREAIASSTVWPRERGNIWMLEQRPDGALRYLSDRWQGRTVGYEERGGRTLAQTLPVMYGMIGLGDSCGLPRPLAERYPWHVVDETLLGHGPDFGARSHAALLAQSLEAEGHALPGVVAIDLPQPGSRPDDLGTGSKLRRSLEARLGQALQALTPWGRSLHVDRACLGLGAGAPELEPDDAKRLYLDVIDWVQQAVPRLTGQGIAPACVLTQGAGSRHDGRSGVILAEAMLEAARPTARVVVAGPAYPYPLMDGMPATPTDEARLLMDEVEANALRALASGARWFCPSLRLATWSGNTITAAFTSLTPLVLENGPHGFRIDGGADDLAITSVEVVKGNRVRLTCNREPSEAGLTLAYAWGWTKGPDATRPANHGALRDSWSAPSVAVPGRTLYRYALSGRVALLAGDAVGSA